MRKGSPNPTNIDNARTYPNIVGVHSYRLIHDPRELFVRELFAWHRTEYTQFSSADRDHLPIPFRGKLPAVNP
jgi:hypothetical protein